MTDKPLFPLALARAQADAIVHELAPACIAIQIAGSIRRKAAQVHDIDIVIWPKIVEIEPEQTSLFGEAIKIQSPVPLLELLQQLEWQHDSTAAYPRKIALNPPEENEDGIEIIPVELYLTEPDGSNFGALLQMRTGCAEFNTSLAVRAQKMSLHYRAGYGIYNGRNMRMDDGSEDGIFKALGITPIPPERRVADFHFCVKGAKI